MNELLQPRSTWNYFYVLLVYPEAPRRLSPKRKRSATENGSSGGKSRELDDSPIFFTLSDFFAGINFEEGLRKHQWIVEVADEIIERRPFPSQRRQT